MLKFLKASMSISSRITTPPTRHPRSKRGSPAGLTIMSIFTPTSASWINQVERWFAELTRKQIQRGVHTSVKQLEADIRTFIDLHNRNPKPFKWTKSADRFWLQSNASVTKPSRLYVANFRFTGLG